MEIDRSMVDQLYDPLVDMIRNSIDHGLNFRPSGKKMANRKRAGYS